MQVTSQPARGYPAAAPSPWESIQDTPQEIDTIVDQLNATPADRTGQDSSAAAVQLPGCTASNVSYSASQPSNETLQAGKPATGSQDHAFTHLAVAAQHPILAAINPNLSAIGSKESQPNDKTALGDDDELLNRELASDVDVLAALKVDPAMQASPETAAPTLLQHKVRADAPFLAV